MLKKVGFCLLGIVLGMIAVFMAVCTLTMISTFAVWLVEYGFFSTVIAFAIFVAMTTGTIFGTIKSFKAMVD